MLTKKFRYSLLTIATIIVGFDQFSKYLARAFIPENEYISFLPHWNWVLVYNHGAAFSFLSSQGGWQRYLFSIISIVVSAILVYIIMAKNNNKLTGIAYSFILGGALGNFIDRAFVGKVTDFIDWFVASYHYAAFNVADSFVCIGVVLIILDSVCNKDKQK